ncbi:nucleic acid-binding protein [Basidiobolus meristosporus CBS 931.73]|uniref:rRNA biogenesis protein RRP5 n=1 Tax=Basidiobolus meristosporus CBS 931.73 TaxID=1314790 RepID=A0A1Y1XXB3_9FUNG|nr:nucleic acid-binding protein [Basidiobolus meristosporus CBS 931.73]|eukprot:ORX90106.1 nucleic acid-binding protein [Basidiobolus meristosporus CBS 931.73]
MANQKRQRSDSASASKDHKKDKKKSEKTSKTTASDSSKPAAATIEDFPRGGSTGLTPLEYKDISRQVNQDILFSDTTTGLEEPPSKKAKASKKAKKSKPSKNEDGDDTEEKPKKIESLNFKRLAIGTLMMGVVTQVNDLDITVSLPNHLIGFVSITEISDAISAMVETAAKAEEDSDDEEMVDTALPSLKELFQIGQYVNCSVTKLEGASDKSAKAKKRIELSLNPSIVNAGIMKDDLCEGMIVSVSVQSVEDHGYLLSTGVDGVTGFLHKKDAGDKSLAVGQVLLGGIKSVSENNRTINVTIDSQVMAKAAPSHTLSNMSSLVPTTLINGMVTAINPNGLTCKFMGFYDGTVDLHHIGLIVENEDDISKAFKVGQKIRARILYMSLGVNEKVIGLSLSSHVLSLSQPEVTGYELEDNVKMIPIGTIFEKVTVRRVDSGLGILCEIDGVEGVVGQTHISRLSDSHVASLSGHTGKYKVGSKHPARVVGYDALDGVLQLSMQKSVLDEKYLNIDDIKVGEVIKGKVQKLINNGILVEFSTAINGFVPTLHMSDIKLLHPEKKFKSGDKVKCKVLHTDSSQKKVILTLKKSLVNSQLPIIKSYSDATPGAVTHGVITSVKPSGCIVTFFNNVKALAPLPELSDSFIKDPTTHFNVGQVVKCRVLTVDPEREQLRVSFKSEPTSVAAKEERNTDMSVISLGEIVSGRVTSLLEDVIHLVLEPSNIRATLPVSHLSDHLGAILKTIVGSIKVGDTIQDMVVFAKNEQKSVAMVSKKPLLVKAAKAGKWPKSVSEVSVGSMIPGYVRNVTDFAVFVGFLGDFGGIAFKNNISDQFVAAPADHFSPQQTVLCNVTTVNAEEGRVELSLKPSQTPVDKTTFAKNGDFIEEYFEELNQGHTEQFSSPGEFVQGKLQQMLPYGWIIELENGMSGFVTNEHTKDVAAKVGDVVVGKILDVNPEKKIYDLTLRSEHVSDADKAKLSGDLSKKKKSGTSNIIKKLETISKGANQLDCVVELVKEDYLVLSLPNNSNFIAFASTKSYNYRAKPFIRYKPGQSLKAAICKIIKGANQRVLTTISQEAPVKPAKGIFARLAKDPFDKTIESFDDYQPGRITKGQVASIKEMQVNINLAANIKGRVHISEVFDKFADIKDKAHVFKNLKPGSIIDVKVIGYHDAKTHKYLPITHRTSAAKTVVELTIKPSEMKVQDKLEADRPQLEELKVGAKLTGFVQKALDDGLWIYVSPNLRGRVLPIYTSTDLEVVQNIPKHFTTGMAVSCNVLGINSEKYILDLSLLAETNSAADTFEGVKPQSSLIGRVASVKPTGLNIQLSKTVFGRVGLTDIADTYVSEPLKDFKKDQYVRCFVLAVDAQNHQIDLSLRPSCFDQSVNVVDKQIQGVEEIEVNSVIRGYIKNINDNGCFVSLGRNVAGRVKISEISDAYVKEWKTEVKIGQLVTARVLAVDAASKRVELSLKKSQVDPNVAPLLTFADIQEGEKIKGSVKRIESYGIFIRIEDSNISGLCHISEVSDTKVQDLNKLYSVGDRVKAVILKIDTENKKVSFGLKATYFNDDDMESESSDDEELEDSMDVEDESDDENEAGESLLDLEAEASDDDDEDEDEDEEEMESEDDASEDDDEASDEEVDAMEVDSVLPASGFKWDEAEETKEEMNLSDSENSDASDDEAQKKKKKKNQKAETVDVTAELGHSAPTVAADYERLLLGSPNSSYLWINYMAFQLQLSEIQKAREIGERAIKAINFREEQERMNVWVAMMNLENKFGTQETLESVFQRAAQVCEPKKIYLQLVQIYERSDKMDLAEQLYKTITKKFSTSSKVWTNFGLFYLKQGKVDLARELLQRSLKSLAKRKHIKTITKFAQLEFKYGEPERGRTIFEGIMSNYPKRVDLWSIYLDMEIRVGEQSIIRRLFQRVTSLKLSSKKMKFFFKKWLAYEKKFGDDKSEMEVKQRALAYIESISS